MCIYAASKLDLGLLKSPYIQLRQKKAPLFYEFQNVFVWKETILLVSFDEMLVKHFGSTSNKKIVPFIKQYDVYMICNMIYI